MERDDFGEKLPKHSTSNTKIEKDCWLRPIPESCCQNYSGSSIQTELEEPLISLSLCLQVSCLQSWGHHSARGVIPRPAGSASSLGFRREKPIRPLNRNNDPPLNTPREERDEEFVHGKSRSSCWQCLPRPHHGELCPLNCSKKPPPPWRCMDMRDNGPNRVKESGLWGSDRAGSELLFCHFSLVCFGNI